MINNPMLREAVRPSLSSLLQLLQADDWEQLRIYTRPLLVQLGIADFMVKLEIASNDGKFLGHVFGSLPTTLLQLFQAPLDDPIQHHLARSCLPLHWQIKQLCLLHTGQIYPVLQTMGVTQGLSLGFYNKQGVNRVDFYLQTFHSQIESLQADMLLFGCYLQEAVQSLWHKTVPHHATLLSARELECLRWSAAGKTSSEIGLILGISQRTVYFHMKNVALKLGVYNTRHAISKAVMLGLIKPCQ